MDFKELKKNEIIKINHKKFKVTKVKTNLIIHKSNQVHVINYDLQRIYDKKKFFMQIPLENIKELHYLKHIKKLKLKNKLVDYDDFFKVCFE